MSRPVPNYPRRRGSQKTYVDGPPWQALFLALRTIWSAAVICPASVCAEHMSAGLDEVRRPGSLSWMRAFAHVFWRVVPGLRWRPCRSSRLVALAKLEPVNFLCEHSLRRRAALRLREHLGAEAFAGLHHRPEDPCQLVGQRHRNQPCRLLRQQPDNPVPQGAFALAHDV